VASDVPAARIARDHLRQVTDPDGLATVYDVDGLGNLTGLHSYTFAAGSQSLALAYEQSYCASDVLTRPPTARIATRGAVAAGTADTQSAR